MASIIGVDGVIDDLDVYGGPICQDSFEPLFKDYCVCLLPMVGEQAIGLSWI